ncbi:MAG: XRE family transcriptional regulator, partial [Bacteroidetes bacterium HGW-Bacteroidetes-3]
KIEENNMLLLVSDNKKYDPYYVPVNEILELWEFTCSINTQEYEEHELKISSIAAMLNQLGIELKALEKSIK